MTTYPEIESIRYAADVRAALRMGYNNFDSVKPEAQPELKARLEALERRLAALRGRRRKGAGK